MNLKFNIFLLVLFTCMVISCSDLSEGKSDKIKIGPGAVANLVLYFKLGTPENEVIQCYRNAIYMPRADGRGEGLRPGYGGFLRLLPSQANGHEAITIDFTTRATDEERRVIREFFESCGIVHKIFENIAPQDIKTGDLY